LVPVLFTFYIEGVLKFKCKTLVPKVKLPESCFRAKPVPLGVRFLNSSNKHAYLGPQKENNYGESKPIKN
jgi:hypothetical protein